MTDDYMTWVFTNGEWKFSRCTIDAHTTLTTTIPVRNRFNFKYHVAQLVKIQRTVFFRLLVWKAWWIAHLSYSIADPMVWKYLKILLDVQSMSPDQDKCVYKCFVSMRWQHTAFVILECIKTPWTCIGLCTIYDEYCISVNVHKRDTILKVTTSI